MGKKKTKVQKENEAIARAIKGRKKARKAPGPKTTGQAAAMPKKPRKPRKTGLSMLVGC